VGESVKHLVEDNLSLHASKRGADAEMNALAEAQMLDILTCDVEHIRLLELRRITVRGAGDEFYGLAYLKCFPVKLEVTPNSST
jgi:hypothetical protein